MATYYVRTTGNDTTGDGSTGTPWATPGKAVAAGLAAGDIVNIGPGTYTLSTSTPNVAGGPVNISGESEDSSPIIFQAEDSNDKPVIDAGVQTGISIFSIGTYGGALRCIDLVVDGQDGAGNKGFSLDKTAGSAFRCRAVDCPTGCENGVFVACEADSCGTAGFSLVAMALGCVAKNCVVGFAGGYRMVNCVSHANTSHGFTLASMDGAGYLTYCTAYDNDGDGFRLEAYCRDSLIANCLAVANVGYGFNRSSASGNGGHWILNCAAGYPNTGGNTNGYTSGVTNIGFVSLTADPFVDPAGGNFALNNTAGGGALLRAAGFPGAFPGGLTISYPDIGAVQHQDAGGSTTINIINKRRKVR